MHIKGRLHGIMKVTTTSDEWSFAGEESGACFLLCQHFGAHIPLPQPRQEGRDGQTSPQRLSRKC